MTTDQGGRQRRRLTATVTDLEVTRQKAFLVGVATRTRQAAEAEVSLEELGLLTDTAGSDPVGASLVRRNAPDPALYIGSGKARELATETQALDVDVVVFDNELTPAQQRNLQNLFECDVVDRVALILDIFAQHATSKEGMLQVELAQLRYRLPRLRGRGIELSRLGGGIGTRGPGETQLETDRRRITGRIARLERELEDLGRARQTRSKARRESHVPLVALVGYTNAGKSTLFNHLTSADVLVEDRLFATVDSTVRKMTLDGGTNILMSDTVGFVRALPHQLVEAFRSTLEEVNEADLMIHVVDGADDHPDRQIQAVRTVLADIGASALPELVVINKTDIADPVAVERLLAVYPGAVSVSALEGTGTEKLHQAVLDALAAGSVDMELLIPYENGDRLAELHRIGEVVKQIHDEAGTRIVARVPAKEQYRFADLLEAPSGAVTPRST